MGRDGGGLVDQDRQQMGKRRESRQYSAGLYKDRHRGVWLVLHRRHHLGGRRRREQVRLQNLHFCERTETCIQAEIGGNT